MKSEITKRNDTEVTLTIKLDEQALKPVVKQTFDDLRPHVKAAGFRPGKAPDNIVERELGSARIQAEVMEAAVQASYVQAIREHKLVVVAAPQVNPSKFVPYTELEFTATVQVMPEIKLADYKKMRKKPAEAKVDSTEIDRVVEDLRKRQAKRAKVERAAKTGDEVVFDFEGSQSGELVPGASSKGYTLILGSKTFIPGFEEELEGLKAGSKKQFDIKFPQDYAEASLAGKNVSFKVIMNEVAQLEFPEDDELAKQAGNFTDLHSLREDVRQHLLSDKQNQLGRQFEQEVMDEVIGGSKFEVPSKLIDQQFGQLKQEVEQNLAYQGLDWDKYIKLSGKTEEKINEELRPEAEKRVRLAIVLTEIAKLENLKVADDEMEAEIIKLKAQYGGIKNELDDEGSREDVYNHLLAQKTIKKVVEYVKE